MYSEEILRRLPCYHCVNCIDKKDMKNGVFTKRKCSLTNRWGHMNKSYTCTMFENISKSSSTTMYNGFLVSKDQIEDYRTEKQWNESGYKVKDGSTGYEMYASRWSARNDGKRYVYYLPEQVEKWIVIEKRG